jgi:hypothetical protein
MADEQRKAIVRQSVVDVRTVERIAAALHESIKDGTETNRLALEISKLAKADSPGNAQTIGALLHCLLSLGINLSAEEMEEYGAVLASVIVKVSEQIANRARYSEN